MYTSISYNIVTSKFRHFLHIEGFGYIEELIDSEVLQAMSDRTNLTPEFTARKNFIVIPPKISDRHGFLRYTINNFARNLNYHPRRSRRESVDPTSNEQKKNETNTDDMAKLQLKNLEDIIIDLYEAFIFINEGEELEPEYIEEAQIILHRIRNAHQRYVRSRREANQDDSASEIYRDMADTIEKLLSQTSHTKAEVLKYQNILINELQEEKTEEILYKDERFNKLNNNIRENFDDMINTVEKQLIDPKCPNFKEELNNMTYVLIASVTVNFILLLAIISRWLITSDSNKSTNTATTSSLL